MNPNTRIAYTQEDGTVAIVVPTCDCKDINDLLKCVPEGASRQVVMAEDIPQDRYFRNAWVLDEGIKVHRAKAEQIHLNKLRVIRDKKLKSEDIEYQKAIEFRDDAKMNAIANRKKKLRDMPVNVDFTGLSLDELKAYIPEILR